jgi:hypothetical protein
MEVADTELAEKFAAFEKEQDPALVYEALEIIEAVGRHAQADDAAAFKESVSLWLGFFAALDRYIDLKWDVKVKPVRGAKLPPIHGVVYPSGEVDPLTIPDPVARAQYEQGLKASHDYEQWWTVQHQLRRIDEGALGDLKSLLDNRYANSSVDRTELEELLATSPLNDARKAQLRALMPAASSAS